MATTDDILKTVSDLTKEGSKYAKELFDKGYDKAKIITEITKLNIELTNQKRTVEKLYIELGKLYYSNRQPSENERIKAVCSKIDFGRNQVDDIETKIENLKTPKTTDENTNSKPEDADTNEALKDNILVCNECGATNSTDEQFCIGCGMLLKK